MSEHLTLRSRAVLGGAVAIVVLAAGAFGALAQTAADNARVSNNAPVTSPLRTPKCDIVPELARIEQPLSRFAVRLAGGLPIRIVAIGSSSTAGAGASTPSNSYPSRLAVELQRHFRGHDISVVNAGVNGEEVGDMLARFDTSVIAENPHLVLWQVGTNAVLRDRPIGDSAPRLLDGIARLKAIRADVVLVDQQFAPKVIAKPESEAMVALLADVAKKHKIGLFRRYEIMRRWHDADNLSFDSFISPDGLHMNDWGYACIAKSIGAGIAEAGTRPTATASVPATSTTTRAPVAAPPVR
jgi:lysophospholipase L1-like esterase